MGRNLSLHLSDTLRESSKSSAPEKLGKVIETAELAVELSTQNQAIKGYSLYYLAKALRSRFEQTGSLVDLDTTIDLKTQPLDFSDNTR